ncbi:MAG: hypothetical protein IK024_03290 [Treponema sp.]|nr:hypothetical protein [Treponema sp.]
MDKRRNKKRSNWNGQKNNQSKNQNQNQNQNNSEQKQKKVFQFNHTTYENEESKRERQKAIQEIKTREIICAKCGQPITELASSLFDKKSGDPIHFECALHEVEAGETLGEKEKVAYIGQGRFGVLYFENPRDQRKFTIKKIIEWEYREKTIEWRYELSGLYSKVE